MQLWPSRAHFDLADPWEHVDFQVRSTFDIVGGAGWHIRSAAQLTSKLRVVRAGSVAIEMGASRTVAVAPCAALLHAGATRGARHVAGATLSILGFSFDATFWGALGWIGRLDLPLTMPLPKH